MEATVGTQMASRASARAVIRALELDAADARSGDGRYLTVVPELPVRLLQTSKLAALGQLVAGIAHELNNPLAAILGYAQLLEERGLGGRALEDARRIAEEAERATRIVRNLLMLAREAKLERSPLNLNEVVEQAVRLCAYDLQRAGIAFEAELDGQLPPVQANPVQMQQVVLNLVMNARQAIAETGRSGLIVLRTQQNDGRVFLEVEDNGPGVPTELQSRIFEPFFTTKPPGVGTGLGLAIVAGILQQHGGEIHVTSAPGAGAKFTVSLPQARGQTELGAKRRAEGGNGVSGSRLLVPKEEASVG